jgi:polyphenol oxidase
MKMLLHPEVSMEVKKMKKTAEIEEIEVIKKTGLARAFYTTLKAGRNYRINDPDSYEEYRKVAEAFGTSPERMVRVNQKHTDIVWDMHDDHAGTGITSPAELGDGMITNTPGLMICTLEADCAPVYLLDPVKRVAGMVHSGWRGSADMISHSAIGFMERKYGCEPSDIIAVLGPAICGDCYEVGDDVVAPFARNFAPEQLSRIFRNMDKSTVSVKTWTGEDSADDGLTGEDGYGDAAGMTGRPGTGVKNGSSKKSSCTGYLPTGRKFLLDIKAAVRITLLRYGLKPDNIYDCGECTYENENLASWRRSGDRDERMLTGIMLV